MDSEAKENVKSYHKYTRIAALLWLFHVGAIVTILYPVVIMQGETEPFEILAFMAIFAVVLLIAAVGCFMKKSWGRKLGLFVSICLLPIIPFGTIAGILGLFGLIKGKNEYTNSV